MTKSSSPHPRSISIMVIAGGALAILGACSVSHVELGGEGSSGPGDGGADAASDANGAPWSSVCPATVPAEGAPCSIVNLRCEYGTSDVPACNQIAYCYLVPLRFTVSAPDPRCPMAPPTNAPSCPATYGAVPNGDSCVPTGLAIGTTCDYAEGSCACGQVGSNITPPRWACEPLRSGCPATPPRFGSACDAEGVRCDYHACDPAGAAVFCQGGVWNGSTGGCATAAGNGADAAAD